MAVYDDQDNRDLKAEEEEFGGYAPKHTTHDRVVAAAELAKEEIKTAVELEKDSFVKHPLSYRAGDAYLDSKNQKYGIAQKFNKLIQPRARPLFLSSIGFGLFGIVAFFILFISQGPMQLVHFAQYLQETHHYVNHYFMNNRLGKAVIWSTYPSDQTDRRNLSFIGNQLADRYDAKLEAQGITTESENSRIRRLNIDTSTEKGKLALEQMRRAGIEPDLLQPDDNGRVQIDLLRDDLGKSSTQFRRHAISGLVKSLEMDRVSSAMAARLLKVRGGVDFFPMKNTVRNADEAVLDYVKRVREDIEKRVKYGVDINGKTTANVENTGDADDTNDSQKDNVQAEMDDTLETVSGEGSNSSKAAELRGKLTPGYGVVSVIGMVCAVQKIGDATVDLTYTNVNLPLMRTGMMMTSVGSQIQNSQNINVDEVGVYQAYLYDEKTKTSWVDATSIQTQMGKDPTGTPLPEAAQPTDGTKPEFFERIDNVVDAFYAQPFCNAVTTTIGGWALTAFGIALTSTGPVSAVLGVANEIIQEQLINSFLEDLIAWMAGDQLDMEASGAVFGAYADYGSALAANDSAISVGGTELTDAEFTELKNEQLEVAKAELREQPLYARYFDINNYHSFASTALIRYAYSVDVSSIAAVIKAPVTLFSKLTSTVNTMFTPTATAASAFDYGFPHYGFTVSEMDDERYDNPYKNAEIVEDEYGLAELNEEYGIPCFNVTIDPETYVLKMVNGTFDEVEGQAPPAKRYDQIDEKCSNRNNERLTRYRMYIIDTVALLTSACYEELDIEGRDPCREIGLVDTSIGQSTGGSIEAPTGAPENTVAFNKGWTLKDNIDYSSVPCVDTSTSEEVYTHPTRGFTIRLCTVNGIQVTSLVSANWSELLTDAKAAGFNMDGSYGWRSYEDQVKLRIQYGCPDPYTSPPDSCSTNTAIPGQSSHEAGLAVDLGINKASFCYSPRYLPKDCNAPGFEWLVDNAINYGFHNHDTEAWHWSPSGW